MPPKQKFLKLIFDFKAVGVGEFMATSKGYFFSPLVFNHGFNRIVSAPQNLEFVCNEWAKIIKQKKLKVKLLGGVATAGISLAAALSLKVKKPFIYIRQTPEFIGLKMSHLDGFYKKGSEIYLVDNLIGKGKNTKETCQKVIKEGLEVKGIFFIGQWQIPQKSWFRQKNIKFYSLVTLEEVIEYLCQRSYFPVPLPPYLLDWLYYSEKWTTGSKTVKNYQKVLKKVKPELIKGGLYCKG